MTTTKYNPARPGGVDLRHVAPDENLEQFCNRIYKHAIAYIFATSALLEEEVYKAQDLMMLAGHKDR